MRISHPTLEPVVIMDETFGVRKKHRGTIEEC